MQRDLDQIKARGLEQIKPNWTKLRKKEAGKNIQPCPGIAVNRV